MREILFGLKLLLSDVDMIGVVAWGKSQGDFHVPFQYYLAFSCFCWRDKLPALLLGSQMSSRQLIVRHHLRIWWGFPADSEVKNLPANAGDAGKIPGRRKWQPTPVFLPGECYGQRSLVGYKPWGRKTVRHSLLIKTTK